MTRPLWKQQEVALREAELLRVARKLLLEHGLQELTMDRLAAATPYSKGTIYHHFTSREDVLAALCIEISELRLRTFERAALFKGRSRERAVAVQKGHSIVFRLHRDLWQAEELITQSRFQSKLSPERRAAFDSVEERKFGVYHGIIRDGIASGDLVPPDNLTSQQILIGLMAMSRGLYHIWGSDSLLRAGIDDPSDLHVKLMGAVYDGLGWRPFSDDWDYDDTVRRVWTEIFPEEHARILAGGIARAV
jgi:AcrR family transcriptional regulator